MARLRSLSPYRGPLGRGKCNGSWEALSPASKLLAYMVTSGKKHSCVEESVKKLYGLRCKQSDETFGLHVLFCILSSVGEKNASSDEEEDIIGPAPPAATVRT